MSYGYTDPALEAEAATGWFDIPVGESTLVDSARARSYSDSFSEKSSDTFSLLTTTDSVEDKYLRGLQILYLLGIEDLITPYWTESTSLFERLGEKIVGAVSLEDLKSTAAKHEEFSRFCENLIKDSNIESNLSFLVREETEDLGDLKSVARSYLYYFIVLGELATSGGVSV